MKRTGWFFFLALLFLGGGARKAWGLRTLYPWFIGGGYNQNFFINYSRSDDDLYRLGRFGVGASGFVGRQFSDHWGGVVQGAFNSHFSSRQGSATSSGVTHLGTILVAPVLHFTAEPWRGVLDPYILFGAGVQLPTRRVLNEVKPPHPLVGGSFGVDYFVNQNWSLYSEIVSYFALQYVVPALRLGINYHFGHPRVIIFEE